MLRLLENWGFIISDKNNYFESASNLKDESYNATLIGKRVAELYIDPLTASEFLEALLRAKNTEVKSFSFLHVVSSTLEMRPLLKVKVKEYEDIQTEFLKYLSYTLKLEPQIYDPEHDAFFDGVKTALMLNDWIEEKDEEYLLEKYSIRPGELRVKIENADWLLYAIEELARISKFQKIISEINKLRIRIKSGVKEELFSLLKLPEIGRVRARKLFNNGIKDIGDVKKADFMSLAQLIGKSVSAKIKEAVGEPVSEAVKTSKRKGQLSLNKFDD
jgi:helicase